jgi:hypothetical protein
MKWIPESENTSFYITATSEIGTCRFAQIQNPEAQSLRHEIIGIESN